jgi:hypothetical protein
MNKGEAQQVAAQLSVDEKMAWVRLLMDDLSKETGEAIFDVFVKISERVHAAN